MSCTETYYFYNICGVLPTAKGIIKRTTFEYLQSDESESNEEHPYNDYLFNQEKNGFDARLLRGQDNKWLQEIRLVTTFVADPVARKETDCAVPFLSPLGNDVDCEQGMFRFPMNANFLKCNEQGFLVHDTCFRMLELVHRQAASDSQPIDLHKLYKLWGPTIDDRNDESFDWGFGDVFKKSPDGQRFDSEYFEWIPVPGSMWMVLDPEGPFDLESIENQASLDAKSGYSFTFSVRASHRDPDLVPMAFYPRSLAPCLLSRTVRTAAPREASFALYNNAPDTATTRLAELCIIAYHLYPEQVIH
ncbi:hypothetical protein BDV18DRAFT_40263 [Aspergillus unguis]